MIESIADLELDKLDPKSETFLADFDSVLKEKLGVSLKELTEPLIQYTAQHAEELALELPNIAPRGDYSQMIEDNDGMANFLKSINSPDDWKVIAIDDDTKNELFKFSFVCTAVDDGDSIEGFTYVSRSGKMKHSFVQYAG